MFAESYNVYKNDFIMALAYQSSMLRILAGQDDRSVDVNSHAPGARPTISPECRFLSGSALILLDATPVAVQFNVQAR